ncbi:ceramide glucosyltransferase [Granulicella aggregans]|uniref:Ceramide glucosyltransferase n=1 Tax=Granulicella aggregans TaxID=474949 RepID=A0A7W8E4X6_9BACT|nr:glycosyltransferase [Granulicella aggregans]MBB5059011.1 ceramide glucosyltransferase [Granulicella aggregans]
MFLKYVPLAVGLFGLLTSSVFLGMVLVGVRAFLRDARLQERMLAEKPEFLPPVTLFKPLHGAEPGLERNLRSFFEQDYAAPVEVLFCARTLDDAGMQIAHRVAAEYLGVTSKFLASGEPWAANAKACSMTVMAKAATHDLWVISDSDVRVDRKYLRSVVLPFRDVKVGCATCLYRGVAVGGIWTQLEAVGMTVEMSSGVMAANLMEPMQFALGPTMVARRKCVAEIGGFEAMVDYCADDFVLGNWIAAKGHRVELIGHAIDHVVLNVSFVDSIRHQIRWMKSTRFSRPKGHFGTSLTFGVPFGIVALIGALMLGMPWLGGAVLAYSLAGRIVQGFVVAKYTVQEPNPWRAAFLFPIRDLMGIFFWAASYGSNRILWRGEVYELLAEGRMRPAL